MNQLEVFNKIGGIIKELKEQYKYLESNPQKLNDLELELFVANAHFLADHAEILSKLHLRNIPEKPRALAQRVDTKAENIVEEVKKVTPVARAVALEPAKAIEPPAKPVEPPAKPAEPKKQSLIEKFFEPVVQQPKRDLKRGVELADTPKTDEPVPSIDLTTGSPKDSYTFIMDEPEVIRHELIVDEDDDMEADIEETVNETAIEEEEEVITVEEPKAPVKEIKPIAKEEPAKDKEDVLTINQKISAQMGAVNNVTEQAGAQPVTNLKAAITLNDKLIFIKDL
ncbi:MAG: hypothetical protein H7289_10595, partial [Mucilaginibacter sp.]|nr:hypothetical protein [Mucilaginibacter sp.]